MRQPTRFLSSGVHPPELGEFIRLKNIFKKRFHFLLFKKPAGVIANKFITTEFWGSSPRPDYIRFWGNFL
jgi:hypothetical protein